MASGAPAPVRIRLWGGPAEVEAAAERIRAAFEVVSESADLPNRNAPAVVRRYLEARIGPDHGDLPPTNRSEGWL